MALAASRAWLRLLMFTLAAAVIVGSPMVGIEPLGKVAHLFAVVAGAAASELVKARVPLRWSLFGAAAAVWVISYHVPFPAMLALQAVAVPYLVYYLGHRGLSGLRFLTRPGDVSYGLYIYAFPVQQALIAALSPVRWSAPPPSAAGRWNQG